MIAALGWYLIAAYGLWYVLLGMWESVHDRPEHHRKIRPPAGLPPSRLRIKPIPDLAVLHWIGRWPYARLCTSSGAVVHFALALGEGHRDMRVLCGLDRPMRRATNSDVAHKPRCAGCEAELRGTR